MHTFISIFLLLLHLLVTLRTPPQAQLPSTATLLRVDCQPTTSPRQADKRNPLHLPQPTLLLIEAKWPSWGTHHLAGV